MTNLSFEDGWETIELGNQQPNGWYLEWSDPGDEMLSAGAFPDDDPPVIETVSNPPECVHKLDWQLPPDEQPGGENALILDGKATYKVFGVGFSASIWQWIEDIEPGSRLDFRVPVQVHHHGDGSLGACAFRIYIGTNNSEWITFHDGLPDPAEPEWVS